MNKNAVFCAGSTRASGYAADYLKAIGLNIHTNPTADTRFLLLDVPGFSPDGQLRGGGSVEKLLKELPGDVVICGGNLSHPALAQYRTVDFLKDAVYLAENAYITAEAALDTALPYINITMRNCPVLIIGWGRIGKCLAKLLTALGADVTVAARKETDRAMLHALGYRAEDPAQLYDTLPRYRLIFNTVPHPILNREQLGHCNSACVKIELASVDGLEGEDVIIARGLPGLHFPESSGKLIAETFLRLCYGR